MSCENNTLDIRPDTLIIKKQLGDTLTFSCTFTDDDGTAINLSTASAINYYFNGSIIGGLGTGVVVSGAGSNIVTVTETIASEAVGNYDHKLVVILGGVTRTYIDGQVKIS